MIGQDQQQPRKERQPRVSAPEVESSVMVVAKVDDSAAAADAKEYTDFDFDFDLEGAPLELDNIVLTEDPNATANVADWIWTD